MKSILYNPFSLEDKTILITGASSGIGKATAIECSQMGATVIITGRNGTRLNDAFTSLKGKGHKQIIADLSNPEGIETILSNINSIDGVVLCAGQGLLAPFLYADREKIDSIFNINFNSPIELLRLLVKMKKINKFGSVVIIASIGGTKTFCIGNSVYGASKAALNAMMHFCAVELAAKNIRVNSICPGMVETPLIQSGVTLTEEQMNADRLNYPLRRYGKPEEVAYGSVYLLSDAAAWITGHSLVIDGGLTCK